LFPVANAFSCNFPTDTLSIGGNRVLSRSFMKDATNLHAEVDSVPIQDLERYQSHSTNFAIQLPADNIVGAPGATLCSPSVADGIYIMLAPLTPGVHTIHLHAEFPASDFFVDVTYHLTVSA